MAMYPRRHQFKFGFNRGPAARRAFTLVEVLVAMGIVGVVFVSLYAGIAQGFYSVQLARENLRATQIMMEKMEVIRVLTWTQINSNNFIPSTFTAAYDPDPKKTGEGTGASYQGTITITNTGLGTVYDNDLKRIDVRVTWRTRGLERSRELSTYYSRYGVQNYLLGR